MTYPDDPAQPVDGTIYRGLTIREQFAAMAMQGLCSNQEEVNRKDTVIAQMAVEQADALIAELNKPKA